MAKLIYRLHTEADQSALIKLWSEHSSWGQIDTETWLHRFKKPPLGAASIVLAIDQTTDEIVGQFAFIPLLVTIDGREVKALRPFAPIVASQLRSQMNGLTIAISMYHFGVKALKAKGYGLIYMLPDPQWMRLLKVFPFFQCGSFPLWSLELPLKAALPLDSNYSVFPVEAWDSQIDHLWQKASEYYNCLVVRDNRTLPWKASIWDCEVIAVKRNNELVGLVASTQKGDRQWLICDLIVADQEDSLQSTIIAVTNLAHEKSLATNLQKPIRKVATLATPLMEAVLKRIGYQQDNYDFPVIIHLLDSSITKDDISPEKWYFSAND